MKPFENLHEKAPKIVKDVLSGIHKYAKTLTIITAENPMGVKISSQKNKERNKEFHELLKRGRYQYIKIKGKYGNIENPVLIINMSKKELFHYADMYNQESVIYGTIKGQMDVLFEYWERNSENNPLIKKDQVDSYKYIKNPDDFYSRIKNWTFDIPFPIFQENIQKWYNDHIVFLNDLEKIKIQECVTEIVENEEKFTQNHFYKLRGNFNYIVNKAKERIKE